jgi:NTE family protein/lysophospholipid hydrolase
MTEASNAVDFLLDRDEVLAGRPGDQSENRLFLLEAERGSSSSDLLDFLASTEVFGRLDREALRDLLPLLEPLHVPAGATVIEEGDPADCLYLVGYGRVQVFHRTATAEAQGVEFGPGKVVGEAALLLDVPRTATVRTIRDSLLLRLSADAFQRLGEEHPQVVLGLHRALATHLLASPRHRRDTSPLRTIAVVPAGAAPIPSEFGVELARALDHFGAARRVTGAVVDRDVGPGSSQVPLGDPRNAAVLGWLQAVEQRYRFVIYEADPSPSPWTRRCLRQADRVLLVGEGGSSPGPNRVEQALLGAGVSETATRRELVLVHPPGVARPRGTAAWLAVREVATHHHLRRGCRSDYERLARSLAGRAVGLVLGGGGARGAAHLGVLRALEEAGVPIDVIGGTSSGALMAASYAIGWDHEARVATVLKSFTTRALLQPTLPLVSLSSGRRVEHLFKTIAGDVEIEDLWTEFFCVSANLSRAEVVVHRRGPAWRAVRASLSLPGILPPVWWEGDLLVDGAILNNLPVDVMRERVGDGRVIAVTLGSGVDVQVPQPFESGLSGWDEFRRRLLGRRSGIPNIAVTIMRATELASTRSHRDMISAAAVDLSLRPPVGRYGQLDFRAARALMEAGYHYTVEQLERTPLIDLVGSGDGAARDRPDPPAGHVA